MIEHNKIPEHIVKKLKDTVWDFPHKISRGYPYDKQWFELDNSVREPIPGAMISTGSVNFTDSKSMKKYGKEEILKQWFDLMGSDIKKWLEDNLYPYGKEIFWIRANVYGEGSSLSLHTDFLHNVTFEEFFDGKKNDERGIITHSITLDKSPDLIGGEIVIADLIMLEKCFNKKIQLWNTPLEVFDPAIGDDIAWDSYQLHGVSKIKKGSRINISIDKES